MLNNHTCRVDKYRNSKFVVQQEVGNQSSQKITRYKTLNLIIFTVSELKTDGTNIFLTLKFDHISKQS